MEKKDFLEQVRDSFFNDLSIDFEDFKNMIGTVFPIFGDLETKIAEKENGGKAITFIDVDEANVLISPKGMDPTNINTDMTTTVMTLHVDKDGKIEVAEHGFHMFTPANKEHVLLLASFIGKKIVF